MRPAFSQDAGQIQRPIIFSFFALIKSVSLQFFKKLSGQTSVPAVIGDAGSLCRNLLLTVRALAQGHRPFGVNQHPLQLTEPA
jgi:hypothetical protein